MRYYGSINTKYQVSTHKILWFYQHEIPSFYPHEILWSYMRYHCSSYIENMMVLPAQRYHNLYDYDSSNQRFHNLNPTRYYGSFKMQYHSSTCVRYHCSTDEIKIKFIEYRRPCRFDSLILYWFVKLTWATRVLLVSFCDNLMSVISHTLLYQVKSKNQFYCLSLTIAGFFIWFWKNIIDKELCQLKTERKQKLL